MIATATIDHTRLASCLAVQGADRTARLIAEVLSTIEALVAELGRRAAQADWRRIAGSVGDLARTYGLVSLETGSAALVKRLESQDFDPNQATVDLRLRLQATQESLAALGLLGAQPRKVG
jgi:hypothetical protein